MTPLPSWPAMDHALAFLPRRRILCKRGHPIQGMTHVADGRIKRFCRLCKCTVNNRFMQRHRASQSALLCAMLGFMSMGAATCKKVPAFHCGPPVSSLQQVQFIPAGLLDSQCEERLGYPWLLDDSPDTLAMLDSTMSHGTATAFMNFGRVPVDRDGNAYAYSPLFRAPIVESALVFLELSATCRDGIGCQPGPFAEASAPMSGWVQYAGLNHWHWFVESPAWVDGPSQSVGYGWIEYEFIPGTQEPDGLPRSLMTYQHLDVTPDSQAHYCWRQWLIGPYCASDNPDDLGLLPH